MLWRNPCRAQCLLAGCFLWEVASKHHVQSMDGRESSMMQSEQHIKTVCCMGNVCQRWVPLLCKQERCSHRGITERSFMQSWLDLCLSKAVGAGLGSCDTWWSTLPHSPGLREVKKTKPCEKEARECDIPVPSYLVCVWKMTFSLSRNNRCLLQAFLQFSTSPASLPTLCIQLHTKSKAGSRECYKSD